LPLAETDVEVLANLPSSHSKFDFVHIILLMLVFDFREE
jgi:hypothetical protein